MSGGPRISDDLRYELAEAARTSERRNRPRGWLILATVLFVAAGIYLVAALGNREAAQAEFEKQEDRLQLVENLKPQFLAVDRQLSQGGRSTTEQIPDLYSRIERAATEAGLRDKPPIPQRRSTRDGDAYRYEYPYTVRDGSLEALLEWVDLAREAVPGLEVGGIQIKPEARAWNFSVTFVRWERSS